MKIKYDVGDVIGLLTVVKLYSSDKDGTIWEMRCACGNSCLKSTRNLRKPIKTEGIHSSCGCSRRKWIVNRNKDKSTHGLSRTTEYIVHSQMKTRCYNKNHKYYNSYGGRGIRVCERWLGDEGFINFFADMGKRPSMLLTLDRIDTNGDYCKENCRWADIETQTNNRRNSRLYDIDGKMMSAPQISRMIGKKRITVESWLRSHNFDIKTARERYKF